MVAEKDPNGKQPNEPGAKLDAGKVCLYRGTIDYFPRALESVAAVSTFGATKYAWRGWQTVPEGFERYSDAMVRHLTAHSKGESTDRDSGLLHAAHAAWNALARLELLLIEEEKQSQWALSDEGNEVVEEIDNSFYLQPNSRVTYDATNRK